MRVLANSAERVLKSSGVLLKALSQLCGPPRPAPPRPAPPRPRPLPRGRVTGVHQGASGSRSWGLDHACARHWEHMRRTVGAGAGGER